MTLLSGSFDGLSVLVTGGAGFVGSHLVEGLLARGAWVTVLDNGSTGHFTFLPVEDTNLTIWSGDLLDEKLLDEVMPGQDVVFHLAANADIRHGKEHPGLDVVQGAVATQKLLEAMRNHGTKIICYASSGAVYGNPVGYDKLGIPEVVSFPQQTSFYGASKLAGESLISAYCETFGFYGTAFRFTPMIGERYSHGHIFDFVKKLLDNPHELEILGSGQTKKYCLYIGDAIEAMLGVSTSVYSSFSVFNVGNSEYYTIDQAATWVSEVLGVSPNFHYTGDRWAGDNPDMKLDCGRIRGLGWRPSTSLESAVKKTVQYLLDHRELLSRPS